MPDMAKLKAEIPHIQVNDRGTYKDVYFKVHPKDRPEGWRACIKIGRTDRLPESEIVSRAQKIFEEYNAFKEALASGRPRYKPGTYPDIIQIYKKSDFWKDLSKSTQKNYGPYLKEIEAWSERNGHPHVKTQVKKQALKWLRGFKNTRRQRAKVVLSILHKIALNEDYIDDNIIEKITLPGRKTEKRKLVIWTESDVDRVVKECDERGFKSLGNIVLTGIETAQRQGDVLRMRNRVDYDDGNLIYIQSKTGKKVRFRATEKLRKRYEKAGIGELSMFIRENTGRLWTGWAVSHVLREICDYLGMTEHIFAHLRHSQVYYLNELKLPKQTIMAITGHSEKTIDAMLHNHYLEIRNEKLANQGIARIDRERRKRLKSHK